MLQKTKTTEPAGYAQPKTLDVRISDLYLAAEAPKGVNLTVRDSGSGSPLTDEELRASIYHNGILVPLIYKRVDGKSYVIAGNRRLQALRKIFEGDQDATAPCQNVDDFKDTDWRQVAIDTNLSLPPHIVERYEQIVLLTKDLKLSPEDARLRFGLTPRQFSQVMALGKMSPVVRKAWKDGTMDAKAAQLFTMEPDPKEQEKVLEKVLKSSHNGRIDEWNVRRHVVPQNTQELGRLVAFVGVEAAKAAKVLKQEDLFASNHVVSDAKTLHKLVGEKLDGIKKQLLDEGWSWALLEKELTGQEWSYGTMTPGAKSKPTADEAAELEQLRKAEEDDDSDFEDATEQRLALEEKIKQRGFTEAQRAKGGCILKILNDGKVAVSYGRTKPEERKAVERSERSTAAAKKKAKGAEPEVSNALIQRLSEQLEKGLREVIKADHRAGVSALIAGVASSGDVIDVKAGDADHTPSWQRKQKGSSFKSVFAGAFIAEPEARNAMLAQIAGEALSITIFNSNAKTPVEDPDLIELVGVLNADKVNKAIAEAFDVKGYFDSVPIAVIVSAVRCAIGEGPAGEVAKMKKSAAVDYAAKHIPATGWLPKQLRTAHYKGPVETAAKKDKKPKPAKKTAPAKKKRKA